MAENAIPKKNTAYTFYVALIDSAARPDLRANPTLAAGDVQVSTDGGAFGNLATLPVVTPASGVAVKVDLSAAEMNGDNVTVKFIDAAGSEWDDLFIEIRPATRKLEDLAYPTTTGRSIDVAATGEVGLDFGNVVGSITGGELGVGAFASGAITADAIAANAIGSSELATDAIGDAQIATGAIAATAFAAGAIDAAAIGTGAIDADSIAANAITAAKIATDAIGDAQIATGAIASTAFAAGAIDAAAIANGAIDAATFAAGAIDAAAIATDAIGSAELADTAAQKIRDEILPTQNAALNNIMFLWVAASDHVTPVTAASGTSVTRSIDGGAFAAGTGTLAEVANGIYQYDASAADMNGGIITFRFVATGGTPGAPDDAFVTVITGGGV